MFLGGMRRSSSKISWNVLYYPLCRKERGIVEQARHSDEILATAPIGRLILKLAVPSVAAQIINMLYNIVDRIYIGHIPVVGDVALTGVGVTFPIITLISAFAAFAGQGGAPLASIQLGAGRRVEAQRILGNSRSRSCMPSVRRTPPSATPKSTSASTCWAPFLSSWHWGSTPLSVPRAGLPPRCSACSSGPS